MLYTHNHSYIHIHIQIYAEHNQTQYTNLNERTNTVPPAKKYSLVTYVDPKFCRIFSRLKMWIYTWQLQKRNILWICGFNSFFPGDSRNVLFWVLWHINNRSVWLGSVLCYINHYRLLMPNQFLNVWIVLFQTIQFSISIVFVYTQLNVKRVLFQTIQFNIQKQFHFEQFNVA